MNRIVILMLVVIFAACGSKIQEQQAVSKPDTTAVADTVAQETVSDEESLPADKDSLRKILGDAKMDSLEKKGFFEDFTFLKMGYLLSSDYKSAILISEAAKDKNIVQVFNKVDGKWVKTGANKIGALMIAQLIIECDDYNFDGLTDIYIQATVSNGVAISRGHLLTQNANSFTYHSALTDMGNMKPDAKSKVVKSQEYIMCDDGENSACNIINEWRKGKLIQVKKECPCKGEK